MGFLSQQLMYALTVWYLYCSTYIQLSVASTDIKVRGKGSLLFSERDHKFPELNFRLGTPSERMA